MYTFLCGLALADLGYLAFTIQDLYFTFSLDFKCDHSFYVKQIMIPICNSFKSTSDFIVICMTIDRCRVMKNITDLRIQALRKEAIKEDVSWNVYFQIVVALVLSFALHLPYFFYEKIDYSCDSDVIEDVTSTTTTPVSHKILDRHKLTDFTYPLGKVPSKKYK